MISHVLAKNLNDGGDGLKLESVFGKGTEFFFDFNNNTYKMKQDKSIIIKSNIVKSQHYKCSV